MNNNDKNEINEEEDSLYNGQMGFYVTCKGVFNMYI